MPVLFETHLLPLYPPDVRAHLDAARRTDANPARNPSVLAHLDDAAQVFVSMHERALGRDAQLDYSDASVHRLGALITRNVRDALARTGVAGTADNALFNVIVHGAAYVGACIVRNHDGEWLVRRPLWESRVRLRSHAGEAELAVLSWWVRALSDDAFDDTGAVRTGLAERYRAYVEVPTLRPDELVPITQPRELPRLTKVRYDTFYKYLHAHLAELSDVGADFPSPERFDAYGFAWLDFILVGEGRMLVVCGPGEGGLHLFWLSRDGFSKSALFASDATVEPVVRSRGDKLELTLSREGKPQMHEILWWGP